MKKLSLVIIIAMFSIGLVACTNSTGPNTTTNTTTGTNTSVGNKITIDEATEIALKHAGVTKEQVSFVRAEKEMDGGIEKYEVTFSYDGKDYDYGISAMDGSIIKYDHKIEQVTIINDGTSKTQGSVQDNDSNYLSSNTNTTANISVDEAKKIALSHAGLISSQVTFKRTELEMVNNIQQYEIEFYYNNREYSYEISANTGAILSYEQD